MKKGIIIVFISIIWLPLVLCGIYLLSGKKIDVKLAGYLYGIPVPKWEWESFYTGEYQQSCTNWLDNSFPPRGVYIKTYNTIQYYLFGLGNSIIGKNDDILEIEYINSELCLDNSLDCNIPEVREEMMQYVEQLAYANEQLQSIGKFLYVYITPTKVHLYHENIPDIYLWQMPEDGVRGIDCFRELMDEAGLEYFDYESMVDTLEYPAFYTTGIHWSRTFEQEVSSILLNEIADISGRAYRNFSIGEAESSLEPYWRDTDIYDVLNLWGNGYYGTVFYQYRTEREDPGQNYDNIRIFLQGGSFAEGLRSDILTHYPESIINFVSYSDVVIDNWGDVCYLDNSWENLDLEEYLNQVDGVIIELNEATIRRHSDGFVNYLNSVLENYIPQPSVMDSMEAVVLADSVEWNEKALRGFYISEDGSIWADTYSTVSIENYLIAETGLNIEFGVPEELFGQNDNVKIDIYINGRKLYEEVFNEEWSGIVYFSPEELPRCEYGRDIYEIYIASDAAFPISYIGRAE